MANNFDQTGVIQVDGAWATRLKYSADVLGPNVGSVDVRFLQGRAEVGRVAVPRERLSELLGDRNRSAIERHIANDADKYLAVVSGELRGRRLHYQEVTLMTFESRVVENSIAATLNREQVAKTHVGRDAPPDSAQQDTVVPSNPDASDASDRDAKKRRRANTSNAAQPRPAAIAPVPEHIAAKYLVKGNAYHFDDQTVAFVDKGTSLTVQTHNKAIIQDLVAIAKARDWREVTVSGTQPFRREAWKAAASAGLTVSGYTPSEIERAALERERSRRETSPESSVRDSVSVRTPPRSASRLETSSILPDLEKESDASRSAARPQDPIAAPAASKREAVTTTKEGAAQGPGAKLLTREQEAAVAIRSAATTREELQLKYPEINRAVFQHLASHDQFADAYIKNGLIRESDRAQVIAQMRDRLASKLEQGAIIREPDNKEVNVLIRRSVNRVAADIGRPPIEVQPRAADSLPSRTSVTREDAQVRG